MIKKTISLVLIFAMLSSLGINAHASNSLSNDLGNEKQIINEFNIEFDEKGYEYAEQNGLLMTDEEMDALIELMNSGQEEKQNARNLSKDLSVDPLQKFDKFLIPVEKIYQRNPELKRKAEEILEMDSKNIESIPLAESMITKNMARLSPDPNPDYRLNEEVSYTKWSTLDTKKADTYKALSSIGITIVTLGFTPLRAIALSLVEQVSSVLPQNCTQFETTSSSHRQTKVRSGQIYNDSGLLIASHGWVSAVLGYSSNTYGKLSLDFWDGSQFKNSTKTALTAYEFDRKYSDTLFFQNKTFEIYNANAEELFTDLYGVPYLPPYYLPTHDRVKWEVSNNPFD